MNTMIVPKVGDDENLAAGFQPIQHLKHGIRRVRIHRPIPDSKVARSMDEEIAGIERGGYPWEFITFRPILQPILPLQERRVQRPLNRSFFRWREVGNHQPSDVGVVNHLTCEGRIIEVRLGEIWTIHDGGVPLRDFIEPVKVGRGKNIVRIKQDHPVQRGTEDGYLLVSVAILISQISQNTDLPRYVEREHLHQFLIRPVRARIIRDDNLLNPRIIKDLGETLKEEGETIVMGKSEGDLSHPFPFSKALGTKGTHEQRQLGCRGIIPLASSSLNTRPSIGRHCGHTLSSPAVDHSAFTPNSFTFNSLKASNCPSA